MGCFVILVLVGFEVIVSVFIFWFIFSFFGLGSIEIGNKIFIFYLSLDFIRKLVIKF